jgi:hypothetical protein
MSWNDRFPDEVKKIRRRGDGGLHRSHLVKSTEQIKFREMLCQDGAALMRLAVATRGVVSS